MAATSCNEAQQLDERQLRAVDLLAAGGTGSEVATTIGVDRTTVWRWQQHPSFRAELARRREEVWSASLDLLRGMLPRALTIIGEAIDGGDRETALALLKLTRVGEVDLGRVGSTDPDAIAEAQAREQARRDEERAEAELRAAEHASPRELRRIYANIG